MPIDPSIAMSYKGFEPPNPLNQLAQVSQIQASQRQGDLAQFQLKQLQEDRAEMQNFQTELMAAGKDPDLRKMAAMLMRRPQTMEHGIQLLQKLKEQDDYQAYLNKSAAPAAPANDLGVRMAPATTDVETGVTSQPVTAPGVARQPIDVPTNNLAPAAPVAAPANQLATLEQRYRELSAFPNVPAAKNEAARIAEEIKQLRSFHVVPGVGLTRGTGDVVVRAGAPLAAPSIQQRDNGVEKWSVRVDPNTGKEEEVSGSRHKVELTPFQSKQLKLQQDRLDKLGAGLDPEDSDLVSRAILDGRLDPNRVNSRNVGTIANTLRMNPEADLRNLALTATTESASARALGNISANVVTASNEAERMIPIVEKYVTAIKPTDYPALNRAGLFVAKNTGDPNQAGLAASLNALVNTYARAINPRGTPTVSDKNHAREVINQAMSTGQFNEVLSVMRQEMEASQAAPREARGKLFQGSAKPAATNKPTVVDFGSLK